MLEACCDLDERLQLKLIPHQLRKRTNTICFSQNMENIVNSQRNHVHVFSLMDPLEQLGCNSTHASPITRLGEMLGECQCGQWGSCKAHDEPGPSQNGIHERSTLRVINGYENKSALLKENLRKPVECQKQNFEKRLSEPITKDFSRLAHSRLIIQQMLEPRMAAAAKTENLKIACEIPSEAEETGEQQHRKSEMPAMTIRTDVDSIPPTFTRPLCDLCVSEGEVALLECNVIARYQPLVLWYQNLKPLRLTSGKYIPTYDGDKVQLAIQNVGSEDVGIYECVAKNACGLSSSSCQLSVRGDRIELRSLNKPKIPISNIVRRSETLPSSILTKRVPFVSNSVGGRLHGQMAALKTSREEPTNAVRPAEEVEEEAVARSTRTEKVSDGGKVTTTTTVTTHKAKDGGHHVTKQTKQITRVGGVGTTNYSINKCSAEEIAERLAGIFEKKALSGSSGIILVKTENWNSQDGITHRNEKSQIWEAPRLAISFNDEELADTLNFTEDIGFNPLHRSATTLKQRLLEWCKTTLKDYQHINIANFSTSWNDGMAFCALIHHFIPDAFDYNKLEPKNRRENFQLAFETAEKRAGIMPLLDVEDMVKMTVPDWKCVFMYVQSIYREFVLPKQEKS